MSEIKTCPWCDGKPDAMINSDMSGWQISCNHPTCHIQPTVFGKSKIDAVDNWNLRGESELSKAGDELINSMDDVFKYIDEYVGSIFLKNVHWKGVDVKEKYDKALAKWRDLK